MKVANLKIENFRGIRSGVVNFGAHPILVGDNNSGKTTLIEALALLLGRDRLVRELTEHDFYGSNPSLQIESSSSRRSQVFRTTILNSAATGSEMGELS